MPRWCLSSSRTRVPNRPLNGATEQPNWFTVQVRLSRCERAVEYVALANLAVTMWFLGAQAMLLGAYLVNGDEGISDNWVGFLAVATLFTALAMSLVALGFSIFAARRGINYRFAKLMRYEFLVLAILVAIAELFVFE